MYNPLSELALMLLVNIYLWLDRIPLLQDNLRSIGYTLDLVIVRPNPEDEATNFSLYEGSPKSLVAPENAEQLSVDRKNNTPTYLF